MSIITTAKSSECPFHASADLEQKSKDFDMFGPEYQSCPATSMQNFREEKPIFFSEKMNYWIVTRYEDIREIFRDPITFSARNALEKIAPNSAEADEILKSYNYGMNRTLVNEDEPIHMERRRELLDAFAAPNLEQLRELTKKLITEEVDSFIGKGQVDLVATLLWDVPVIVALKFLGVPDDDIAVLQNYGVAHKVNTWGRPSGEEQKHVATNVGKFWHYSGEVLARMKQNSEGKSGWMYDMIHKNKSNPRVVTDNYLHSMMMAILVAAHETTATATANAIRHLLLRPNLWKKLHDQPELIPAAVEECLRYAGPIVSWRRQATKDVQVAGVDIKEGDKLFLVMAAANRDPQQFENPEELDILRDNANEHLSFGYGAHQCLGRNIGRLEMCAFIEELTRRIPDMEMMEQNFTSLPNTSFHGPEELWVRWDPNAVVQHAKEQSTFPIGNPDKRSIVRSAKVAAINNLTPSIKRIVLESADDILPLPRWTPGAHIELFLPNGLKRKYSLCPSEQPNQYTVLVKHEPESQGGSRWIHEELQVGDQLPIQGPKNFFKLDTAADHYLLVAGGIGITPLLSMATELHQQKKRFELIYCGRTRDNLAYCDIPEQFIRAPQLYISGEGRRADLRALVSAQKPGTHIYACGPDKMLDELDALAEEYQLGLTFELFSSASSILDPEKETAFEVELIDTGKTYLVPRDKTLLEVLLAHDIEVTNDCEEGLCGSCEVVVVEGQIDHRDRVLTANERRSNTKMMSCCSRAVGKVKIKL
ncbi:cytochrome P450/oxidoreductase [Pusillimonas sp. ANT_WB101]|uniref:cytochrome P450/oxidoreductase n=1 Tax=Pusillimonas sp. ANT_WB101 TaxID=2597356 RepID=UPI001CAA8213|nr:cytochrome P450/oxidoreductase [Pusillimonas sp. ANT_WB101]